VTRDCDRLNAYLDDTLQLRAAEQFSLHLSECNVCREAVEQQRWMDRLLRSGATAAFERSPTSVRDRLESAIHVSIVHRRQTSRIVAGLFVVVAAAVAAIAVGWTLQLDRQFDESHIEERDGFAQQAESDVPVVKHAIMNAESHPRATFVSSDDSIAVPVESADEDVTIVKVYPTTDANRRMRLELAYQFTHLPSDGG
jgi:hypothetical protein